MTSLIKIDKVYLNFSWNFDIYNNDCAICRCSLIDNDNNIVIGKCGHAFHEKPCLESWLKKKNVCPLCNKKWEVKK